MKNVKVLFALLVVALATVFIYSCAKDGTEKQSEVMSKDLQTETRAGDPCENVGDCLGVIYQSTTETVSLDEYPGCTFEIAYSYRQCGNNLDLILDRWQDNPSCQAFNDDLNDLIVNNPSNVPVFLQHSLYSKLSNFIIFLIKMTGRKLTSSSHSITK